jgi:hypothetical protein
VEPETPLGDIELAGDQWMVIGRALVYRLDRLDNEDLETV